MPGAGTLNAANHVYSTAPQDGTVMLAPLQTIVHSQLSDDGNARVDAARFQWIGNPTASVNVIVTWHTSAVDWRLRARSSVRWKLAQSQTGVTGIGARTKRRMTYRRRLQPGFDDGRRTSDCVVSSSCTPTRLSTMTGFPRFSDSLAPMMRATRSA
jgi:hypothetical protein